MRHKKKTLAQMCGSAYFWTLRPGKNIGALGRGSPTGKLRQQPPVFRQKSKTTSSNGRTRRHNMRGSTKAFKYGLRELTDWLFGNFHAIKTRTSCSNTCCWFSIFGRRRSSCVIIISLISVPNPNVLQRRVVSKMRL